ncbi:hypothetical protein Cni_G24435 [Canna indica]|uniref:Uncharacterized protein n=1 Tax=Canna indica TaxID=4628 RepID=A0AAQ3KVQ0_9LILI|nr:hypothetical protein Cni_G24435 [Canna indica]
MPNSGIRPLAFALIPPKGGAEGTAKISKASKERHSRSKGEVFIVFPGRQGLFVGRLEYGVLKGSQWKSELDNIIPKKNISHSSHALRML